MNKNYYQILEIDRNASPEIIEKAYKTLAKKYHPDLQDEAHKKQAEEKFKIINEAYETLSNSELKALYDQKLSNTTISQDKYNEMYEQNEILKNKLNNLQQQQQIYNQNINNLNNNNTYNNNENSDNSNTQNRESEKYRRNLEYEQQLRQAREKAYYDAYVQDLKNRGYKIRYKKTFSDYLKAFISIVIVIFVLFILWHIPFVKNYFIDLYNNNVAFRTLGNVFINLFN